MNRALKTGTNLRNAKKSMMTNIQQISQVPTMNSFCLYLTISVLSFIHVNKAFKIQQACIGAGYLSLPTPGASCSINCIYHLVNVLLILFDCKVLIVIYSISLQIGFHIRCLKDFTWFSELILLFSAKELKGKCEIQSLMKCSVIISWSVLNHLVLACLLTSINQ